MKTIYKFFFLICATINSTAQNSPDCGCNAALRYDILKSKNDFYSEMLLAREINKENYKDIQQKAGGDFSIFGIGIGVQGENIQKIKEIYNERLYNRNIVSSMSEYESITTSNISYNTFKDCMQRCIRTKQTGIDAYIIAEDENYIYIDLHYAAAQYSPPLAVSYNDNDRNRTTRLRPNTWADPAIKIERKNKDGFSIVFSAGGQYESVVVPVKPYRPITANLEITYNLTKEVTGSPITYSTYTRDNSSGEKGSNLERKIGGQVDEATVKAIVSMADGGVSCNDYMFSSQGYWATRVGFKATARDGYFLRNPRLNCDGSFCNGWAEGQGFIRNDQNMIIYTEKRYSGPCTISFTVDTYKSVTETIKLGAISTNKNISIVLPPGNSDGVIRYVGGALKLGDSNAFLKLIVKTISAEGYDTYDYLINPDQTKPQEYLLQFN